MRFTVTLALIGCLIFADLPAQAQLNTNLILNPGADLNAASNLTSPPAVPTSWVSSNNAGYLSYGTVGGFPTATDPRPSDSSTNFFFGGVTPSSSLSQSISLVSFSALIDAGAAGYDLSGWLGGYLAQRDSVTVTATFLNNSSTTVGSATIGPVTNTDRGNLTGLFLRSGAGIIPVGTRTVTIQAAFTRLDGSDNDGYADSLSFKVTNPASASAPEPETLSLLLLGLLVPLARRARR